MYATEPFKFAASFMLCYKRGQIWGYRELLNLLVK